MHYISATETKNHLARVIDMAIREPVVIQRNGRNVAALISMEDYELIRNAKVQKFQALCDEVGREAKKKGMTEAKLNEILNDKGENGE